MTDRELLERAAKAAGLPITGIYNVGNMGETIFVAQAAWNPLTDDGDAFRLAVALRLGLEYSPAGYSPAWVRAKPPRDGWQQPIGTDPAAATRRAIVRAAAGMI